LKRSSAEVATDVNMTDLKKVEWIRRSFF